MYCIARKRVHLYTCIQYENRKVACSAQRDVYQIAVSFMLSVFEFQLFLLVIIWFVLQSIATNDFCR